MKTCTKCKEVKDDFPKHKKTKDGLNSWCRDCMRAAYRENYQKNKQAHVDRVTKWRKDNEEHFKAYTRVQNSKRRALVKNAEGEMPKGSWEALLRFYGGVCLKCGATERLELDHIIPLSKGGRNDLANSQVLCKSCNTSKRELDATDYRDPTKGLLVDTA